MKSILLNKKAFVWSIILLVTSGLSAQFSDSFTIYFTKTANIHKQLPNEPWVEQFKKDIPKFKKDKYILTGKNGMSTYKLDPNNEQSVTIPEWLLPSGGNEVIQYPDSLKLKKDFGGSEFIICDSHFNFKWKITNDKRNIAGYNCRKAVAKFQDSILIYAFFAEELIGAQGPEVIHGLPGVILGLGIPAFYTNWFADKVVLNAKGLNPNLPIKKKQKQYTKLMLHAEMEKLFGGKWNPDAEKMYWKLFF